MEEVPAKPEAQYSDFSREIDAMVAVDQGMREKSLKDDSWDEEVDAKHTARMKEIIDQIGWPTISKVGKESSKHAWLLVQHADHDVEFQSKCLEMMKQEAAGEVDTKNIAMLEDRVRVNQDRPQIYGTQFSQIDGKHIPRPIEDETRVDERRKEMGLGTLEENIAGMYEKYGKPK